VGRVAGSALPGSDDRSILISHAGAHAIYDLDLERRTDFVPNGQSEAIFRQYRELNGENRLVESQWAKHHRYFDLDGEKLNIVSADRRTIASYPCDRNQDELDLYPTFDKSGESLWMRLCANPPDDYTVYAVEVATGRTHTTLLGNRDRVWLLPDWGQDGSVWIYHCDGQYTGYSVVKHTVGAEYQRGPWHYLDTDRFKSPNASKWDNPYLAPLHCRNGRLVICAERRLWVYQLDTAELTRGPMVLEGDLRPNECPSWEWSSRDRFAIQWNEYLTVHNPETLETLAAISNPGVTRYYHAPVFLADNRIAIAKGGGLTELWQL
jgi:hypothetical protein